MVSYNDAQLLRSYIQKFLELKDEDWNLLLPHLKEMTLEKNQFFIPTTEKKEQPIFILRIIL